ncbi:complement C1q-like protein 3 [Pecten maximus]|uniref:complement C1q-like protein 3 n=1 Tax=Pecten maximus TaxID=6579 RepID=UPI001458CF7D|nr:complement C1q-like protein 3 [Pecten maximus]
MFNHKRLWLVELVLVYIASSHGTYGSDDVNERLLQLETAVRGVQASARQQKSNLEDELANVQSELSALQHKYQNVLRQLETSASKSVRSDTGAAKYAFSASLSQRLTYNSNEKIVMDHVLTNEGNNYDPQTGVFTCQQAGTYVFYVTIQVEHGHSFGAEVVKNAAEIAWVLAEPTNSRASASTSVIVNLSVGDIVYVRSDGYFDQDDALIDDQFSSFSGFLIEVGGWVNFGNG